MSQDNTENIEKENIEKEIIQDENVSENQPVALTVEEQLQEDLAKEKDKFLRLFAEFENYKKRTTKERIDLFKTANQEVLQSMLPVLDDFDRAWDQISKSEDEALVTGVALIHEKLKSTLVKKYKNKISAYTLDISNQTEVNKISKKVIKDFKKK